MKLQGEGKDSSGGGNTEREGCGNEHGDRSGRSNEMNESNEPGRRRRKGFMEGTVGTVLQA